MHANYYTGRLLPLVPDTRLCTGLKTAGRLCKIRSMEPWPTAPRLGTPLQSKTILVFRRPWTQITLSNKNKEVWKVLINKHYSAYNSGNSKTQRYQNMLCTVNRSWTHRRICLRRARILFDKRNLPNPSRSRWGWPTTKRISYRCRFLPMARSPGPDRLVLVDKEIVRPPILRWHLWRKERRKWKSGLSASTTAMYICIYKYIYIYI